MSKILIGKINSVFGIKGAVKLISFCEDPIQIEKYPLFDDKGNSIKLKISNKNKAIVGTTGSGNAILIAEIAGVTNRNDAEKLRGTELFVERKDFKETKDDEFYYVDLIGLDVVDMESKKLGKVINVYDFGAGGMLEIEFTKSDSKKTLEKIENFHFKKQTFPEVNLKKGFIRIDIPEVIKG
ncbi:MAG: 16S rRNA processing protein RimM [Rickettsiales bacterium]|nr:16S rRNA processing protein RimM [Rickettsiales bacterium]